MGVGWGEGVLTATGAPASESTSIGVGLSTAKNIKNPARASPVHVVMEIINVDVTGIRNVAKQATGLAMFVSVATK